MYSIQYTLPIQCIRSVGNGIKIDTCPDNQRKTHLNGYTLMDTGVGSFAFMAGLISLEARHSELKKRVCVQNLSFFLSNNVLCSLAYIIYTIFKILALVTLVIGQLCVTLGNYMLHWSIMCYICQLYVILVNYMLYWSIICYIGQLYVILVNYMLY